MDRSDAQASWALEHGQAWISLAHQDFPVDFFLILVLRQASGGALEPVAWYPKDTGEPDALLVEVAERCASEKKEAKAQSEQRDALAVPVWCSGELVGLVAAASPRSQMSAHHVRLQRLATEAAGHLVQEADAQSDRFPELMQALVGAMSQEDDGAAAEALVTELAMLLSCERVAIGFREGLQTEVIAISNAPEFRREMVLVRQFAAVMDEAIDQAAVLQWPALDSGPAMALREHAALGGAKGQVLTVPFQLDPSLLVHSGALVFERAATQTFSAADRAACQTAASLGAHIVALQVRAARPWHRRLSDSLNREMQRLRGPSHYGHKLVAATAVLAMFMLPFADGTYRIGARATLEGVVVRTLVAPFDGYVEQARFRAGDKVKLGTEIASLDRRDLRLELIRAQGQVDQYREQYNDATARRDRAQMAITFAQFEQAVAQAQLTQDNLARSSIQAPFDGLIVSGDLHQQLGASVRRGQTLFEVSPTDRYRVVLEVPDAEIDDVRSGQSGVLRLAALPEHALPLKVARVTPVTAARDGAMYFRVEAELDAAKLPLRPGMIGNAWIEAGTQPLGWIWLHSFFDWLRLHLGGGWR